MGKPRISQRARKNCPHLEITITRTAGIERAVCEVCGHVTLQHFEDGVGEHTVITSTGLISRAG